MANVVYKGYTIKFQKLKRWEFVIAVMCGQGEVWRDSPPVTFKEYGECLDFAEAYIDDLISCTILE